MSTPAGPALAESRPVEAVQQAGPGAPLHPAYTALPLDPGPGLQQRAQQITKLHTTAHNSVQEGAQVYCCSNIKLVIFCKYLDSFL